jgi:hypothetical protein
MSFVDAVADVADRAFVDVGADRVSRAFVDAVAGRVSRAPKGVLKDARLSTGYGARLQLAPRRLKRNLL